MRLLQEAAIALAVAGGLMLILVALLWAVRGKKR